MMEARALALQLPAAEDANSIQVGLMRIQKALIDDTISTKKAGLLLYSMQLAMTNVGQTTFGKAADDDLVTDTVDEAEAISSQHSAFSEQQNQTFETRRNGGIGGGQGLPMMSADDTETEKSIPRMDADERGLGRNDVERMVMKPIFTRDIPGLAEYLKPFTTEGTEDTEKHKTLPLMNADDNDQRRELPRIDADERGSTTMQVGSLAQRDPGQMHAKMG